MGTRGRSPHIRAPPPGVRRFLRVAQGYGTYRLRSWLTTIEWMAWSASTVQRISTARDARAVRWRHGVAAQPGEASGGRVGDQEHPAAGGEGAPVPDRGRQPYLA